MAKCSVEICERPAHTGELCHAHYMRLYQTGELRPDVPIRPRGGDPQVRLWLKVDKNGPIPDHRTDLGPCWIWTGSTDRNGYGTFKVGRKMVGVHRFAYEAAGGTILDGEEIDHLCRRRNCVRSSHLEAVSHLTNMQRAAAFYTRCSEGHELSGKNVRVASSGARVCVTCARRRALAFLDRRSADVEKRCAVEGCGKPERTRGWCSTHYARWLRHGKVDALSKASSWAGVECKVDGCTEPVDSLGYCTRHYRKWHASGDPLAPDKQAPRDMPMRDRLLTRIERRGECWLWTGKLRPNGYAIIRDGQRGRPAQHVAHEIFIGPVPEKHQVDQACGNRHCIAPGHLVAVQQIKRRR